MVDVERLNKNKNINRGYRNLIVWQEAVRLYRFVKIKTDKMPSLPFKIKSQVLDSILSVGSNIAEGYSRRSIKENINFNNYALGSLSENYSQIFTLMNSGEIDKTWFDEFDKMHYSLENKLTNLIKKQIQKLQNKEDWNKDFLLREDPSNYNTSL